MSYGNLNLTMSQSLAQAAKDQYASAIAPATPQTQYEQMCDRIGTRLKSLNSEIHMLRDTLSALLPGEAIGAPAEVRKDPPPEHGSPLMGFMRHIETELGAMRDHVEHIRVRTPF